MSSKLVKICTIADIMESPTGIDEIANRLAISSIRVGDLAITSWRFRQYWRRYIFKDLGRFEVEIGDSKNMVGLRMVTWFPENVTWFPVDVTWFSKNVTWFPKNESSMMRRGIPIM